MLNNRGNGHPRPYISGAALANLAIVVAFAVIASLLLTKTLADSHGIRSDIDDGITPQLAAVDGDLTALPVLDATGRATERIALAILPIAVALGRAADATTAAARDTVGARDDGAATKKAVSGIDSSMTATLGLLQALGPILTDIVSGTGDIRRSLTSAERQTAQAAVAMMRALDRLHGVTADAGALGRLARDIEAVLKRIEGHGAHAAAAPVLRCPDDPRACVR